MSDKNNDTTATPGDTPAPSTPSEDTAAKSDLRALRRAQRAAEKAARAQRRAEKARHSALEAARAGGLIDEVDTRPTPAATQTPTTDSNSTASETTTSEPKNTTETPDEPSATTAGSSASNATGDPAKATTATGRDDSHAAKPGPRKGVIPALAALSLVLLALTGLATWGYLEARSDTRAEQTIVAAPQEATEAAREIVTLMFTYDHRTVDADLAKVREHLVGPALEEFVESSMPTVASAAKQMEATVFSTVAAAAVEEVKDAENITVLVMLNRMISTNENPKATASSSRLRVDMVKVDGQWKLNQLNPV